MPTEFRSFLEARIPEAADIEIAQRSGISRWTLSRQVDGESELKIGTVVAICRTYDLPFLVAFAAAGFITAEEADAASSQPNLEHVTEEELLREVLRRVASGSAVLTTPLDDIEIRNVGGQSDDVHPPIDLHAVDLSNEFDLAASHDDTAVETDRTE